MKPRHKRMFFLLIGMLGLGLVAVLVFKALSSNLSYFFYPTEVIEGKAPKDHLFRLGGLVAPGSVERGQELAVRFVVTDNVHQVTVTHVGILPDLFKEGQGVIAQGRLGKDGVFVADEVLAKHDETYMPKEVAEALEKSHQASQSKGLSE